MAVGRGVNVGESYEQAAARELEEELGDDSALWTFLEHRERPGAGIPSSRTESDLVDP